MGYSAAERAVICWGSSSSFSATLRTAELEMRAAEEPLRSDLDVKGLKAQVLGRIEELEERERERVEMLSEVVPAMEVWGYDTGTSRWC